MSALMVRESRLELPSGDGFRLAVVSDTTLEKGRGEDREVRFSDWSRGVGE